MHMIVPIVPVVSNNVQTSGTTIWGTLPGRSQTTQTSETTSIARIELSSIRTIGTIK